ncbi:MAG TPA: Ldh family oxidoreductase, partial [Exilispira sp.]|nr:Ldh family oxidoreductase [Exilispira sp.]
LAQGAFMKQLLGYDEKGNKIPYKLGHFFIAINIENFVELASFKKMAGDIMRQVRNSKKMPGHSKIWTAGEKEYEAYLYRKERGVPVDPVLQKQIKQLIEKYDLKDYNFDF